MKRVLKIIFSLLYFTYLKILQNILIILRLEKNPLVIILYYHSVYNNEIDLFDRQMKYLAANADTLKSFETYQAKNNRLNVAITFDDGFENVLKNAIPILEKYSLPYTIFFVTNYLGKKPEWEFPYEHPDKYERIMTGDQINLINSDLFSIGSHTCNHRKLDILEEEEIIKELEGSKKYLEELTGHTIELISFPNGRYNNKVIKNCQKLGYKKAFSIEPENGFAEKENMLMGRFDTNPSDWFLEFWLKINGGYLWQKHWNSLKELFLKR